MKIKWLILIFLVDSAYGQYDGSIDAVMPVSPSAASMFKAVQRPVGSYTGTTPIDIPVYNVKCNSLAVPVSLSYNNGGIRVEEVAGWCGLGWSLAAGGTITRTVNGIPDDQPAGGYLNSILKPSQFPGSPWIPNVMDILENKRDIEPDIYYFNYSGGSGRFFFDESGKVVLESQVPVQIVPVLQSGKISGWVLTDDKGIRYYFGMDKAKSRTYIDFTTTTYQSVRNYSNIPEVVPPYSSSWYLTEIRDMNEDQLISFAYDSAQTQFKTKSGEYMRLQGSGGLDCGPADSYGDIIMVTTLGKEKYVKRIVGGMDSLVFFSSGGRIDHPASLRLDSIKSFDRQGILRKTYRLSYDYFLPFSGAFGDEFNRRLKLTRIGEFGNNYVDSMVTKFEYIEDVNLPSRLSNAVDYWGYYNGMTNNTTLMPNGVYDYLGVRVVKTDLADRRSYPSYSMANTLKKIIFPTGGHREFEYEGNTVLPDMNSQIKPDFSQEVHRSFYNNSFTFQLPSMPVCKQLFTVNSHSGSATFYYDLGGSASGACNYTLKLFALTPTEPYPLFGGFLLKEVKNQRAGSWELNNGNYRIEVWFDNGIACTYTSLSGRWSELVQNQQAITVQGQAVLPNNTNAGGIRVKKITDYDPISGKSIYTRYQYQLPQDSLLTSGLLISPVIVAHIGGCSNRNCQYIRLSATSHYPLAREGSSYVVYPNVRTIEDGNGFIDHIYSFAIDGSSFIDYSDFPITPPESRSWMRGKLLAESIYNQNKQLIRQTATLYPFINNPAWGSDSVTATDLNDLMNKYQLGWKVTGYYYGNGCTAQICSGCWKKYQLGSYFSAPKAYKETTYSPEGNISIKKEFFYYRELSRPVLQKEKVYINNNRIRETSYKYAFNNVTDFTFGLTAAEQTIKATLQNNHYLQPLEIVQQVVPVSGGAAIFTGGTKSGFANFNINKIYPAYHRKYISPGKFTDMTYNYNSAGNIIESTPTNGVKTVYLWGYREQYPVAKIAGSDYNTIAGIVNAAVLNAPANAAALRTELNKIHTALTPAKAIPETYVYLPLVGIVSALDVTGKITYYEYDGLGRLILIRDASLNILKKIEYQHTGISGSF